MGDEVDGSPVGLGGYKMKITGGSDRNGNPMRGDLPGMARKRLLLSGGIGFHPRLEGERRRKMVRGNEITPDFVQVNALVTAYGEKSLGEHFKKGEEKAGAKEEPAQKTRPAKR
jgi:small subunit ribosomal protein S6e